MSQVQWGPGHDHIWPSGPGSLSTLKDQTDLGMGQNPGTPGEPQNSWDLWMFIPLKMYL